MSSEPIKEIQFVNALILWSRPVTLVNENNMPGVSIKLQDGVFRLFHKDKGTVFIPMNFVKLYEVDYTKVDKTKK